MPKLIRLYVTHVAIGFGLALAFVALLLTLDVGGLRHLVLGTRDGWLGGVLLVVFNGLVFAGVQFGIAVMALSEEEDGPPRGRRRMVPSAIPLVVRTRDRQVDGSPRR